MSHLRETLNPIFESRRFLLLLVAQIVALFVFPLLGSAETEGAWFQASVGIVLATGVYAASARHGRLIVAIALLLPAAFAWFGPDLLPGATDDLMRLMTASVCLLYTAGVVGHSLSQHERVSRETLLGGVNVYLLLVFAFALVHVSVEVVNHGSYTIGGRPLFDHVEEAYAGRAFATIVYFSVTTLSTLGYGDIIPAREGARMLTSIEAIVGPLFLAIFIGRLVGLQVGERRAFLREEADHDAALPVEAKNGETAGP